MIVYYFILKKERTKCMQDERHPQDLGEKAKFEAQLFLPPTKEITTLTFHELTNEMERKNH